MHRLAHAGRDRGCNSCVVAAIQTSRVALQDRTHDTAGMRDYFISYTAADRGWAVWVAFQLESLGFSVVIQDWDFHPGSNFMELMDQAAKDSRRTIAILSRKYLEKAFPRMEMFSALATDPIGKSSRLIPVRIESFEITGILNTLVYIDLAGCSEDEAFVRLERGIMLSNGQVRGKPGSSPPFPREISDADTVAPRRSTPNGRSVAASIGSTRFINTRVVADDWLATASIANPYQAESDPTDTDRSAIPSSITSIFWVPNDQYFASGPLSPYTPAVAICSPEPEVFLRRILNQTGSETFAKLQLAPSKIHNEDRQRLFAAIGQGARDAFVACIAVPRPLMEPGRHQASLGIQTLVDILFAPILTLHSRLSISTFTAFVAPAGTETPFLLGQTKRLTKAVFGRGGVRSTVEVSTSCGTGEGLARVARLMAWATSAAHNTDNPRWVDMVAAAVEGVGARASHLEAPAPD